MGGTWQSAWELVSTQWMFLFVTQMATVRLPLMLIDLEKSVWEGGRPLPIPPDAHRMAKSGSREDTIAHRT